jgi:hypothetical protein
VIVKYFLSLKQKKQLNRRWNALALNALTREWLNRGVAGLSLKGWKSFVQVLGHYIKAILRKD